MRDEESLGNMREQREYKYTAIYNKKYVALPTSARIPKITVLPLKIFYNFEP